MLAKPIECEGCPLFTKGLGFSRPEGHGTLGVLVFGEALGRDEARDGLPFRPYAQAGSLLERVIKMCGLDRQQLRLTNIIQCHPPNDFLDNAPWELGAVNHCQVHRDAVVESSRPKVLLALGNVALRYLTGHTGKSRGISYMRGYVLPSLDWGGLPVVSSFHPAFIKRGKMGYINVLAHDIRKAIAIAQGRYTDYCLSPDSNAGDYVNYISKPTLDDAHSYYDRAKANTDAFLSFDLETNNSMFKEEDNDEEIEMEVKAGEVTQIQFSLGTGEAIAMPWEGEFRDVAIELLQLPNQKVAHNGWRFDVPVLKRERVTVRGTVHDTRWMWHHLQPDLPAHLQFVGSFYGMPFPWKHYAAYDEGFYGCADADVLSRIMALLPRQMEAKGVWHGYERQIRGLEPILVAMSKRGIPVDDKMRIEFGQTLDRDKAETAEKMQAYWPSALVKWKEYKKPPLDKMYHDHKKDEPCNPGCCPLQLRDITNTIADPDQIGMFNESGKQEPVMRWSAPLRFNPGSHQQLKEYMHHFRIAVPTDAKDKSKETTGEIELLKVINRLKLGSKKQVDANKPHAQFLTLELDYREVEKMKGTFVDGWAPASDGCVHPIYHYGTAVGQLASKNPNGQNFPKRSKLAKEMRKFIRARPDHVIIEVDYSSFHAVTLAFEAESINWLRLARSDIHSFTTAHFLKLPERDHLLEMQDEELKDYLRWVKEHHRETRDNKAKHAILGVGNGLGYRKLYRQYSDYFESESEAKTLLDTIRSVFPEVFAYQNRRRREAHERTYLVSKFGYVRWFFDVMHWDGKRGELVPGDDSESALCYHHVNDAFGHIREQMLWMHAQGWDEKYGFFNTIHDSLLFHCHKSLADECVSNLHHQMTLRSPVLHNPLTAPTGLYVDVEVSMGEDWASLKKVPVPPAAGLTEGPEGLATFAPVLAEANDALLEIPPALIRTITSALDEIPF